MARLDSNSFRNWNDGNVMKEADYEQERSMLIAAINDNFDRLVKSFKVLNEDGSIAVTQNLNTAINFLQFKKSDSVDLVLDSTTGTLTIAVKPDVFATQGEHDALDERVQVIEDANVPQFREDVNYAIDKSDQAIASVEWLKINKDFQMRPVTWKDLKDYSITWGMLRSGMVKFYAFKFWRFE